MFGRKRKATIYVSHAKGSIEIYDKFLDMVVLRITIGDYEIYVYIEEREAIKLAKDILENKN